MFILPVHFVASNESPEHSEICIDMSIIFFNCKTRAEELRGSVTWKQRIQRQRPPRDLETSKVLELEPARASV